MTYTEACKLLNIAKDTPMCDIKKKWRHYARKYHPDLNNGNDYNFKLYKKAYDIICNNQTKYKMPTVLEEMILDDIIEKSVNSFVDDIISNIIREIIDDE